jgi:hypothetical protein
MRCDRAVPASATAALPAIFFNAERLDEMLSLFFIKKVIVNPVTKFAYSPVIHMFYFRNLEKITQTAIIACQ